jgi:glycosyltransferase involved in cell wall biosynthesis
MPRPAVSVVIACKDEEHHLESCVASVLHWADEILIADSGSTDCTREIAASLCETFPQTCRLVQREFINYGSFKSWASQQCRHDWVFVLDADERMTPALANEIDRALSSPVPCNAYAVRFQHHFLGHPIRFGPWGRHRVVRLFRKSQCHFNQREVHESIEVPDGRVGRLVSPVQHFTCSSLDRWFRKKIAYAVFRAKELAEQGRKAGVLDLAIRPILRFLVGYFLRLGCLDGLPGLIVAIDDAFATYLKYVHLWELQQKRQSLPDQQDRKAGNGLAKRAA